MTRSISLGYQSKTKILLQLGANPNPPLPEQAPVVSYEPQLPVHALFRGTFRENIFETLVQKEVDLNAVDHHQGNTVFHYVARSTNAKLASLLLDNGAALNVVNNDGDTPVAPRYCQWIQRKASAGNGGAAGCCWG